MIRDALEYTGIIIDKKTLPSRLYRLYKYGLEKNQKDLEKIKNFKLYISEKIMKLNGLKLKLILNFSM